MCLLWQRQQVAAQLDQETFELYQMMHKAKVGEWHEATVGGGPRP